MASFKQKLKRRWERKYPFYRVERLMSWMHEIWDMGDIHAGNFPRITFSLPAFPKTLLSGFTEELFEKRRELSQECRKVATAFAGKAVITGDIDDAQ